MRRISLAAVLLVLAGCSTSATISRLNGGSVEARIRGMDTEALLVETSAGQVMTLSRADITDIDHPGNPAALVGGIIGVYGLLNIAVAAPDCSRGGTAYCAGAFLPAAVGIPMLVWGLWTWMSSKSAAETVMPMRSPDVRTY